MACPICKQRYEAVDQANRVCKKHQDWVISRCSSCGIVKFVKRAGICLPCAEIAYRLKELANKGKNV